MLGLLFDGQRGTLTYYKDGACLGVAFRDLHCVREPLYPAVSSTAAKTEMCLANARRDYAGLQDRYAALACRSMHGSAFVCSKAYSTHTQAPTGGSRLSFSELIPKVKKKT